MVSRKAAEDAVRNKVEGSELGELLFFLGEQTDDQLSRWRLLDTDGDAAIVAFVRRKAQGSAPGRGPGSTSSEETGYALQLMNLPTPSALSFVDLDKREGAPLLRNWRLAGAAGGLPPALQHPAFGVFLDWVLGSVWPSQGDMQCAAQLCSLAAQYYNTESELQEPLIRLLRSYLGVQGHQETLGRFSELNSSELKPDWHIVDDVRYPTCLLLAMELKNGFQKGDPSLQGFGYYSRFWSSRILDVNGRFTQLLETFRRTRCPTLLIEVLGPHLRVSSLAWLDCITLCPMTPLLNTLWLGGSDPQVVMLARALRGIKEALEHLRSFYDGVHSPGPSALLQARLPGVRAGLPYPLLEEYGDVLRVVGANHLYKAKRLSGNGVGTPGRVVAIKFSRHYCLEAHREWAALGLAPELLAHRELRGGFVVVEMELLEAEQGWQTLHQLGQQSPAEADSARATALAGLRRAYEHCTKRFVHGDARSANCMVRRRIGSGGSPAGSETGSEGGGSNGGGWEVRFIDFEFAGVEGVDVYPEPLNPAVPWAEGAGYRLPLRHSHDIHLLSQREPGRPSNLASREVDTLGRSVALFGY